MSALRISWYLPCLVLPFAACPSDAPATDTADVGDISETSPDITIEVDSEVEPDSAVETTDTVETASDVVEEVGPVTCQLLDFSGNLEAKDALGVFQLGGKVDLGLGGPLPDAMIFEFYTDLAGTFDLAANGNENYKTCDQCVRFVQDIDSTGATQAKNLFQKAGTLTIDAATPPNGTELKVTLTGAAFEEVSIRAVDFQTTPVENGACYQHPEPLVLETGACKPACGDHVCGPDGCGGTCGEGCRETETCHLDGSVCEAVATCMQVALDGALDNTSAGVFRLDVTRLGLGAVDQEDFVQIEFYKDEVGTFNLASSANRNYASCNQCFRLVVDGKNEFYQRSGSLVLSPASVPMGDPDTEGYVDLQTTNIILEEVVIDEEFNSIPLTNGACIELVDGQLSSPIP